MKVYLDASVYNRPHDDQSQPRIFLESQAFAVILQMIEAREVDLVSSSVLEYENSRNPFPIRRRWVSRCLSMATRHQLVNDAIRARAEELKTQGVDTIDALHVASAEGAKCEYFVTCDDRVTRRYRGSCKVVSPVDFLVQVGGR